jgi:hypothetical protein
MIAADGDAFLKIETTFHECTFFTNVGNAWLRHKAAWSFEKVASVQVPARKPSLLADACNGYIIAKAFGRIARPVQFYINRKAVGTAYADGIGVFNELEIATVRLRFAIEANHQPAAAGAGPGIIAGKDSIRHILFFFLARPGSEKHNKGNRAGQQKRSTHVWLFLYDTAPARIVA